MVSPKTRGIRSRGTLLKRRALKGLSSGLIALICALFSIGITLEGISINNILNKPFNLLSIIGLIGGSTAIIAGIGLYREGHKLQNYWKRRRNVKQMFKIKARRGGKRTISNAKNNKTNKKKCIKNSKGSKSKRTGN